MAKLSRAAAVRSRKKKEKKTSKEIPSDEFELSKQKTEKELFVDSDEFQLMSDDLPASADIELKNFLEKNELLEQNYQVSIYKFDDELGNKKTYCKTFNCQCPTEHEIGMEFGGGRYYYILQVIDSQGKRKGTTRTIYIHKNYDKLMQSTAAGIGAMFPVMPVSASGNGGGGGDMQNALVLMKTMMSMFFPLIQQMGKPQKGSEPAAYTEMMVENMRSMNEAQKQMFLDNSQFWGDRTRESAGLSELHENEEETTGIMGTVNAILPVLEKMLPAFIGKPPAQTQAAVNMVKNIPGYSDMIKDKKTIKRLLTFITEKHGPDAAKQVLKEFGIKKPK